MSGSIQQLARRVAMFAVLATPLAASAQTATDPHHPAQGSGTAAPPSSVGASPMMGGGMMMPMMQMMSMMQGQGMGMMRMGENDLSRLFAGERVEGRLAFMRAELKITEPQAVAWTAFADIVRTRARQLGEARAHMAGSGTATRTLPERLEHEEHLVSLRGEALRALKPALTTLYAALSEEQRKTAEQLLAPPRQMNMMEMMHGAAMPMNR